MADVLKWIQELVGHTPGIVVVGSAVVGLLGFTSYLWSRPKPLSFGLDYDNQSFILEVSDSCSVVSNDRQIERMQWYFRVRRVSVL